MATVWTVKGGRIGEREERMLEHSIIGGGWESLRSLEGIRTRADLRAVYEEDYPDASTNTVSNYVGQLFAFTNVMARGELVVLPLKTTGTIAVGEISGDYVYRADFADDFRHTRPVRWIKTDIPRDAFDQDLLYSFGAYLTFGRVQRDNADSRIRAVMAGRLRPQAQSSEERAIATEDSSVVVPNIADNALEQVRQVVSQRFSGHDLTSLVKAVLEGLGFTGVSQSPPGADRGVDLLAGFGPLGMDAPRLAVQVKTGQAGVDEFRQLRGTMADFDAEQGLLVAWGGFRGTVRSEARTSHYSVRLWDASDLLENLFTTYERLDAEVKGRLPLKQILVFAEESD